MVLPKRRLRVVHPYKCARNSLGNHPKRPYRPKVLPNMGLHPSRILTHSPAEDPPICVKPAVQGIIKPVLYPRLAL